MNEEAKAAIVITVCGLAAVVIVAVFIFYIAIEIPRMRHESPTQQLYNRCLASQGYADSPSAKNCQYVLKGDK